MHRLARRSTLRCSVYRSVGTRAQCVSYLHSASEYNFLYVCERISQPAIRATHISLVSDSGWPLPHSPAESRGDRGRGRDGGLSRCAARRTQGLPLRGPPPAFSTKPSEHLPACREEARSDAPPSLGSGSSARCCYLESDLSPSSAQERGLSLICGWPPTHPMHHGEGRRVLANVPLCDHNLDTCQMSRLVRRKVENRSGDLVRG